MKETVEKGTERMAERENQKDKQKKKSLNRPDGRMKGPMDLNQCTKGISPNDMNTEDREKNQIITNCC